MRAWVKWVPNIVAGLIAGLAAAVVMTLLMALSRYYLGIMPPPESVPDRVASMLDIPDLLLPVRKIRWIQRSQKVRDSQRSAGDRRGWRCGRHHLCRPRRKPLLAALEPAHPGHEPTGVPDHGSSRVRRLDRVCDPAVARFASQLSWSAIHPGQNRQHRRPAHLVCDIRVDDHRVVRIHGATIQARGRSGHRRVWKCTCPGNPPVGASRPKARSRHRRRWWPSHAPDLSHSVPDVRRCDVHIRWPPIQRGRRTPDHTYRKVL